MIPVHSRTQQRTQQRTPIKIHHVNGGLVKTHMGTERYHVGGLSSDRSEANVHVQVFTGAGWVDLFAKRYAMPDPEALALAEFRALFDDEAEAPEDRTPEAIMTFWDYLK